jgi:hypothetical protein
VIVMAIDISDKPGKWIYHFGLILSIMGFAILFGGGYATGNYYDCNSGDQVKIWEVLDGESDCKDGSDELQTLENQEIKKKSDYENSSMQNYEQFSAALCCLGAIFWAIAVFVLGYEGYLDRFESDEAHHATGSDSKDFRKYLKKEFGSSSSSRERKAREDNPNIFDQMVKNQMDYYARNPNLQAQLIKNQEKERSLKCSYCDSDTEYECDVSGCKSGICKKCRGSGKAKANYTKTIHKRGWITNQVSFNRKGYQCKNCSTNPSIYGDDGSDVGDSGSGLGDTMDE